MPRFILARIQSFWPFKDEDRLDVTRSVGCSASSHDRQPPTTLASAPTEAASFQTAVSRLSVAVGLDRLGSKKPDNGETASEWIYACYTDDAARASSRDHTER